MKVALVHEFLTQLGGAERVLEAFHEIFPGAPIYTLVYDAKRTQGVFANCEVRTSVLQKLPRAISSYKWYLALMPTAIESFSFEGYDLVLSDSSAFAKGLKAKKPTVHVCYCHTPTRYLWENMDEYVASLPYSRFIKWSVRPYLKYYLKGWDYAAAQRPDFLIANSKTVQDRVRKYYNREAEVIYPPVDTAFFRPVGEKQNYYLTASRLEPYKKIDLVVEAFDDLGLPLKVAGDGTQLERLKIKYQESKNIDFLGRVSDHELRKLYSEAKAFVFPALEDAGIVVLESLSCGTPVIGLAAGGTPEFVRDEENGVLFERQTVEDITRVVKRFETLKFDPKELQETALPFDKEIFKEKIRNLVAKCVSA